jgi:hypothetical protein
MSAIVRLQRQRLLPCQTGLGAGTLAGTNIENIATASYDAGAGTVDIQSNTAIILVDELLEVTVAARIPATLRPHLGAPTRYLTYQVTNNGNGPEAFTLTPNVANSGDDFDPALVASRYRYQ